MDGGGPLGGVSRRGNPPPCLDLRLETGTDLSCGSTEANVDTERIDEGRSRVGEPNDCAVGDGGHAGSWHANAPKLPAMLAFPFVWLYIPVFSADCAGTPGVNVHGRFRGGGWRDPADRARSTRPFTSSTTGACQATSGSSTILRSIGDLIAEG